VRGWEHRESRMCPQLFKRSHGRWPPKYGIYILGLRAIRDSRVLHLAGSLCEAKLRV